MVITNEELRAIGLSSRKTISDGTQTESHDLAALLKLSEKLDKDVAALQPNSRPFRTQTFRTGGVHGA